MYSRTILALIGAAALSACATTLGPAEAEAPTAPIAARAQIMVLGVYHFRPGGSDRIVNQVDDHLSPRRQAEIADVLQRLERFRPTKIVVELDPEHEAQFNERYARYRAGEVQLGVNERDQLGMALAHRLGHTRLYAADASSDMHFDDMLAAAQANGQEHLLDAFNTGTSEIEAHQAATRDLSVRDRLIDVNSPMVLRWNDLYLTMAQMGSRENPIGAQDMSAWWGRNLHIFAQIAQLSEPGDRILVIYGSGHKFLLDHYFEHAREFELIDPLDYLRTSNGG